jgi:hypothetical protein
MVVAELLAKINMPWAKAEIVVKGSSVQGSRDFIV